MELIPLRTGLLHAGDDLSTALRAAADIRADDVIVVSSKAVATCENAFIDIHAIHISDTALSEAEKTGRSPGFCQAVLDETARMDGRIVGRCPGAMLCLVRPADGIHIVAANAGMDQSNVPEDTAIGWPKDSAASAMRLRSELGCPVIITDSCCTPLRAGITAYALACAGIDPVRDERGKPDLYEKPLRITRDNVVDELSAAANFLMGNAAQATPAVIVRDHGLAPSTFAGWVPTFPPEEDLFRDVLRV